MCTWEPLPIAKMSVSFVCMITGQFKKRSNFFKGKLYFTSLASPIWSRTLSGDVGLYSYAIATGRVLANGGDGVVVSIGFHQNSQFAGKVSFTLTFCNSEYVISIIF